LSTTIVQKESLQSKISKGPSSDYSMKKPNLDNAAELYPKGISKSEKSHSLPLPEQNLIGQKKKFQTKYSGRSIDKTANQPKTMLNSELKVKRRAENLSSKSTIVEEPNSILSSETMNKELFVKMSSKAITDQYLLPVAIEESENKPFKVASLDLKSVASFTEPRAIYTPYPKYPRRAWSKMISQTVRVAFRIGIDGKVSEIDIVEGADRDFSREINRRLRKWQYKPATRNGIKVAHKTSLEFVFEAPQKKRIHMISTGTRIPKY